MPVSNKIVMGRSTIVLSCLSTATASDGEPAHSSMRRPMVSESVCMTTVSASATASWGFFRKVATRSPHP